MNDFQQNRERFYEEATFDNMHKSAPVQIRLYSLHAEARRGFRTEARMMKTDGNGRQQAQRAPLRQKRPEADDDEHDTAGNLCLGSEMRAEAPAYGEHDEAAQKRRHADGSAVKHDVRASSRK